MPELEKQLEIELLALYEKWKSVGPPRNFFLQMVKRTRNEKRYKGPVGTVRYLLAGEPASGFIDLVRAGKSDWTVEALILEPRWQTLFTNAEREKAAARLKHANASRA